MVNSFNAVHGFARANESYNVIEGETLNTTFQTNIKGMTHFRLLIILGAITSIPTTAGMLMRVAGHTKV